MEEEFCLQAKNPASSCVHSLLSLILKHSRRALVIAKTWRGLTKQDVNPVLRFRLTEETWKCSHLKQVLPNAFISHKCYFSFSLLLPFLFLLFFFLPFLAFFWPPTTNICIICYRTLYPVTPQDFLVIESLTFKKQNLFPNNAVVFSVIMFLSQNSGEFQTILQLVKDYISLFFINFM